MDSLKIVVPPPFVHKVGNLYRDSVGYVSILAQVGYRQVALVTLNDNDPGNRFRDPVAVKDIRVLTAKEWDGVQDGTYDFVGRFDNK